MSDHTLIEQQLLTMLKSQRTTRKKYHRLWEVYPVISEMIQLGYLQVDINQLVNEGGLPLHFETFKTYLRRCRHAMAEKAPIESRETIQESVPKTLNNTHSDPIVNEEESGISRQNNRSLKAILDARDRGSDPDIDRYLAAKKPLNRRKS